MKTKLNAAIILAIAIPAMVSGQNKNLLLKPECVDTLCFVHYSAVLQKTQKTDQISNLVNFSAYCDSVAEAIRLASLERSQAERNMMMEEVHYLRALSQKAQLKIYEHNFQTNDELYDQHNLIISGLLYFGTDSSYPRKRAEDLTENADWLRKMAKAMMKEASFQETTGARLGVMMNAEDLQLSALKNQKEAINLLEDTEVMETLCYQGKR